MTLHQLILNAELDDPVRIDDYEFGGFDLVGFWRAGNDDNSDINQLSVKIAGTQPVDLLCGPLSLPIVSSRLRGHLSRLSIPDVAFKEVEFADDFYLMNFTQSHDCISLDNSVGWTRNADGTVASGTTLVIEGSKIPENTDVFRLHGTSNCILFQDSAAKSLIGKDVRGLAFLKIKCSDT